MEKHKGDNAIGQDVHCVGFSNGLLKIHINIFLDSLLATCRKTSLWQDTVEGGEGRKTSH